MRGPAHTLRVALARVSWPLPKDPTGRDDLVLSKTLRRGFQVVRAREGRVVVRRDGLTIAFRQLEPHRAAVLFRRGDLDEAPVPLGDIRAALADETVRDAVRVRRLSSTDVLAAGNISPQLRNVLDATANRTDYAMLVPEDLDAAAPSPPARIFRAARRSIATLPDTRIRVAVPDDTTLRYGASLLVASWRDLGLDIGIRTTNTNARFARASFPTRWDIPIAHGVDARFVSPRVRGWREDARGVVDYSRVTLG